MPLWYFTPPLPELSTLYYADSKGLQKITQPTQNPRATWISSLNLMLLPEQDFMIYFNKYGDDKMICWWMIREWRISNLWEKLFQKLSHLLSSSWLFSSASRLRVHIVEDLRSELLQSVVLAKPGALGFSPSTHITDFWKLSNHLE